MLAFHTNGSFLQNCFLFTKPVSFPRVMHFVAMDYHTGFVPLITKLLQFSLFLMHHGIYFTNSHLTSFSGDKWKILAEKIVKTKNIHYSPLIHRASPLIVQDSKIGQISFGFEKAILALPNHHLVLYVPENASWKICAKTFPTLASLYFPGSSQNNSYIS